VLKPHGQYVPWVLYDL